MNPIRREWLDAAIASDHDQCIDWPWPPNSSGYPVVADHGVTLSAHVEVCEAAHGPRPDGMQAAHSCGRTICCNPRHLRWATQRENAADKVLHGTNPVGARHPRAVLTEHAVLWLRSYWSTGDYTHADLAARFGISRSHVANICAGRRWAVAQ